jgi:hypothetical protein
MRKTISVLTIALSLVVGLVICEIIIRKVDGVPLWPLRHPSLAVAEYHPLLGWRQREYLGPGHRFITGAFGLRMNSVGVRPPEPGGILVVGDSFTLGSEVREHETFPAQLERQLGRQVMNAAVHGYGSEQMILNAEDLIPILQPSFLVIGMMDVAINRAGYEVTYGDHRPWFDVSSGELRHHNNRFHDDCAAVSAGWVIPISRSGSPITSKVPAPADMYPSRMIRLASLAPCCSGSRYSPTRDRFR